MDRKRSGATEFGLLHRLCRKAEGKEKQGRHSLLKGIDFTSRMERYSGPEQHRILPAQLHTTATTSKGTIRHSTILALSFLSLAFTAHAAATADFLIVEKPSALTVFDRYEQMLSESKLDALSAWTPLQVVKDTALLGDQITRAMHVKLGSDDYYLLRGDDGELNGLKQAGRIQRFRNCTVLGDTVHVAAAKAIAFVSGAARTTLAKDALLVRHFESGGRTYCLRMAPRAAFGWCEGPRSAFVSTRAAASGAASGRISQTVARRIRHRFETVNQTYASYFGYFNKSTGQDKAAPMWIIDETGDMIRCTLKASPGCRLDESTRVLAAEIESLVQGEGLKVAREGDCIEVRAEGKQK